MELGSKGLSMSASYLVRACGCLIGFRRKPLMSMLSLTEMLPLVSFSWVTSRRMGGPWKAGTNCRSEVWIRIQLLLKKPRVAWRWLRVCGRQNSTFPAGFERRQGPVRTSELLTERILILTCFYRDFALVKRRSCMNLPPVSKSKCLLVYYLGRARSQLL